MRLNEDPNISSELPSCCGDCIYEVKLRLGDDLFEGYCKCTGAPLVMRDHRDCFPVECYMHNEETRKEMRRLRIVSKQRLNAVAEKVDAIRFDSEHKGAQLKW